MTDTFADLKKISREPAAKLLAEANLKLDHKERIAPSAPVSAVLAELDAAGEDLDIIRLMSVALPPREAVWWSCLAARDFLENKDEKPLPLVTAEKWVFQPNDETREAARAAAETADPNDDTSMCAAAAAMSDGTLGPGDFAQYAAPAGVSAIMVLSVNLLAMGHDADKFEEHGKVVIARALDIARGGNGTDIEINTGDAPAEDPPADADTG